jgi:hypothetical protein
MQQQPPEQKQRWRPADHHAEEKCLCCTHTSGLSGMGVPLFPLVSPKLTFRLLNGSHCRMVLKQLGEQRVQNRLQSGIFRPATTTLGCLAQFCSRWSRCGLRGVLLIIWTIQNLFGHLSRASRGCRSLNSARHRRSWIIAASARHRAKLTLAHETDNL